MVNFMLFLRRNIIPIIFIMIFIVGSLISKAFLSLYNLQSIAINVSIIGVIAIGQMVVMLTRQIDLSVGALMAFCPITAIKITQFILAKYGIRVIQGANYVSEGLEMIILFSIIFGCLIGYLNGFITVKANVPPLITTLGMLFTLRGISYILSGGFPLYLTSLSKFRWLGTETFFNVPVCFLLFILIGLIGVFLLNYTKIGPRVYSTGGNERAAIYSGINVNFFKIMVYVISGFCASIAALVYSSRLESAEVAQATGYEFISIAIVIIGGTTLEGGRGRLLDTVFAALILAIVINITNLVGLLVWYQNLIIGLVIIGAAFAYLRRK